MKQTEIFKISYESMGLDNLVLSFKKLDIMALLQTIEALVKDVPEEMQKDDEAVSIALKNIVEMIDKIRNTLEDINKETEYHRYERW